MSMTPLASIRQIGLRLLTVALALFGALCTPTLAQQNSSFGDFNWATAKLQAMALPRPRSFPAGRETTAIFHAATAGARQIGFKALIARLDYGPNDAVAERLIASARNAETKDEKAMVGITIKNAVLKDANVAQEAGFAALVTGTEKYRQDAMRLMRALAALDPRAETSVATEDLSAMLVARTLALGLDWFYPYWTPSERTALTQAIAIRMEDFAQKLVRGPRTLEMNPWVSHDNEVIGGLAEVAVLLLGETPLASQWYEDFVPLYARLLTPFGGIDGGYANGTTYASWDVGEYSLRQWDTLRRTIGLDLTKKQWAQNFGRYLAYFLPPGTPSGMFGNGAELDLRETWARYAKAYAARVPTPLARWYAAQWFQENSSKLELLTAPVELPGAAPYPVDTANSAVFPSIGWVAMHSHLQDRGRTSLYFKSSPYGSVSHSHSDQNSFVLHAGGRPLLIDSGYYDYYGSAHHFGWNRRTVAHNAVTFDGGKGQDSPTKQWGDAAATGQITQFSTNAEIDYAVGDATAAYLGQLKRATRAIAYIRPDAFLIFDYLDSQTPRKWEWNLHSQGKFTEIDARTLRISNAESSACIHFQASIPTSFGQTNTFPAAPLRTKAEPRPDQWHGHHVAVAASTQVMAVTLIQVGCSPSDAAVQFGAATAEARIAGLTVIFNGQTISVQKN